jgi:putative transposase
MVRKDTPPSLRRQCEMLAVNRSSLYYEPLPTSAENLALMRKIDELHVKFPFYGSRKITQALKGLGHDVNRKRVQRLMRQMGLEGMVPKANTSRPAPEHAVYPYLLRNLEVSRVNQVWAADISAP